MLEIFFAEKNVENFFVELFLLKIMLKIFLLNFFC